MPQRLGTGLTVGRKVIQRGDELVALVRETVCFVALKDRLHVGLLPALSLIGIKNLQMDRDTHQHRFAVSNPSLTQLRLLTGNRDVSERIKTFTWNILGISSVSALYTSPCVTGLT